MWCCISNQLIRLLVSTLLLMLSLYSTEAYLGVIRQANGTDIELRTWYRDKKQCGETTVLTGNGLVVFEGEQRCGYICQWKGGEPYSSYKTGTGGALTCSTDKLIRQGKMQGSSVFATFCCMSF